jgi:aspartate carbamoyltransferase catalytic subunit
LRHLLTTEGLTRPEIEDLLDLADEFLEVLQREIPKVPTLLGATVATMFFEPSTRTRLSFERAARALSSDVLSFNPGTSSVTKGESLKDTALTLRAMGADLMVVRHRATGAAHRVAQWVDVPVVNAGDGAHQHPTQALLDSLTLRRHFGKLDGLRVGIVGDIRHSRVARSNLWAFSTLGARVTLVAPPTLLPLDTTDWPCDTATELDPPEYVRRFGLDGRRFDMLPPEAVIMHPGPMNRGVEIAPHVADHPRTLILDQVRNGVAARMAVLFRLLGAPGGQA